MKASLEYIVNVLGVSELLLESELKRDISSDTSHDSSRNTDLTANTKALRAVSSEFSQVAGHESQRDLLQDPRSPHSRSLSKGETVAPGGAHKFASSEFDYFFSLKDKFSFKTSPPLIVLHVEEVLEKSIFLEPQKELFQKMILALKINPQDRICLEVRSNKVSEVLMDLNQRVKKPLRVLLLCREPSTVPEEKIGFHLVYQTFSPSLLLDQPTLKKTAWGIMQLFRGPI